MRRTLCLLVVLLGAVLGPVVAARAASPGDEARFLSLTNGARAQAGAPALRTAVDLVAFARHHSDEMAASGRIYHSSDLESGVHGWEAVAENVGRGSSVDYVHQLFMQSATHRHNIVDPRYTEVGIGVTWRGDTLYVTEIFRQPVAPAPAATVPTTLAPAPAPAPPPTARRAPARVAPTTTSPPAPSSVRLATTTTAIVLSSEEVDALAAAPAPKVVRVAASVPGDPTPVAPASVAGVMVVLLLAAHLRVRYSLR